MAELYYVDLTTSVAARKTGTETVRNITGVIVQKGLFFVLELSELGEYSLRGE